jgi:glutathione S-transferase
MNAEYVLYGMPISLFTRKLESALIFYRAPFRNERKAGDIAEQVEMRAGTHQVPALLTPENWMIADTTPIIALLDARFPARRLVPEGPLGVLVHIVEEILDEWFARTMVHFRWHYEENTRHVVSALLEREVTLEEAREFPLAKWGPRACRATGTESEYQQQAAEKEYFAMLDALESQLAATPYALGGRPTAVDTILLGGLRAHTNADPVPDLSGWSKVCEWDASRADAWDGGGSLAPFPASTPFAAHITRLGRDLYAPFALGNAEALAGGHKAFSIDSYGEETSYLAREYPERSRRMIQQRIRHQLDAQGLEQVGDWLDQTGLAACFMP